MGASVLDELGQEITGVAAPVSLCMALTVLLVRLLNPEGSADGRAVYIASIAYSEQASDSAGEKLSGALLNAIIFIAVIGAMTFVLFLLFKFGCTKVIYAYMGFSVFNIFFFLTGAAFCFTDAGAPAIIFPPAAIAMRTRMPRGSLRSYVAYTACRIFALHALRGPMHPQLALPTRFTAISCMPTTPTPVLPSKSPRTSQARCCCSFCGCGASTWTPFPSCCCSST